MNHPARTGLVVGTTLAVVVAVTILGGPASASGPTIGSFSPGSANVGTTITIDGSGLSDASEVAFNYNSAAIVSDSDSQITATVPLGNDDGPVTVTTPDGTATSATNFVLIGFYVTPATLPAAQRGSEYSVALQAAGGQPPYRWSMASGRLPKGLSLTHQGVLSGILTFKKDKAGTDDFTVQVRDSTPHQHQTARRTYALTVD